MRIKLSHNNKIWVFKKKKIKLFVCFGGLVGMKS